MSICIHPAAGADARPAVLSFLLQKSHGLKSIKYVRSSSSGDSRQGAADSLADTLILLFFPLDLPPMGTHQWQRSGSHSRCVFQQPLVCQATEAPTHLTSSSESTRGQREKYQTPELEGRARMPGSFQLYESHLGLSPVGNSAPKTALLAT